MVSLLENPTARKNETCGAARRITAGARARGQGVPSREFPAGSCAADGAVKGGGHEATVQYGER